MVKIYYFISACLLLFSCNNNNKEGNVNDTINDTIVERLNNPLAGKKFYYLEKDKTGTLILKKYPQFEGDFEMQKIIFTDSMLIDGWNVMEPSKWYVSKIIQKDTILSYYVNMEPFGSAKDTFRLQYDKEKGKLYMFVENNTITLIDSLYSDRVKIKNVKVKLDDN